MNLHPRRDTPVPQNQQTPTATSPAAGVFNSCPFIPAPFTRPVFPSHSALFHNGSISRVSLPLRHGLSHCPPTTDPWATFSFRPLSTTAAFSAFLCRCGIAFSTDPLLQTPWATFSFRPLSTTAAFPAFLCRCGMAFLTDPLLQAFREIVPPSKGEFLAAFPFH